MPEQKSKFLGKILDGKGPSADEGKSFTSERQHTAQAFNLHVERRDGRRTEGFAWSHYVGYRWTDEGEHEKLVVLFGMRAIEIEGHNLGAIVADLREGQLNGIKEMTTAQATLKHANAENEPIVSSIKSYPDFDQILKDLKGEEEHETGHAGRVRGR
jgi:hypothetical protein